MIYFTQLIFVKEGKEELFHQFENLALPLLEKYNGKILYRLRPDNEAFISAYEEKPYEIHLVTFPTEEDFEKFMHDDNRNKFLHLKEESVRSTLLIKGMKL